MWFELGIAVSLLLVLEGLLPAVSPRHFRQVMATLAMMDDRSVRATGLISMAVGAFLLYLLRH